MKSKQSLYDFIENKIKTQQTELNSQLETLICLKVNPILDAWVNVKPLEDLASRFADSLSATLETYKIISGWDRKRIISDINSHIISLGFDLREKVVNEMTQYILHGGTYEFYHDPLNNAKDEILKSAQPIQKKLKNLVTLGVELRNAIAREHNGDRAYKALAALGVGMKDYTDSMANLPAVIKLSVDPCLINGDCN